VRAVRQALSVTEKLSPRVQKETAHV